jgi:hypothetical protein
MNVLHISLINDVEVLCWLLLAHWCHQAMPIFGQQLVKSIEIVIVIKSEPKLMT